MLREVFRLDLAPRPGVAFHRAVANIADVGIFRVERTAISGRRFDLMMGEHSNVPDPALAIGEKNSIVPLFLNLSL